MLLSIISTSVLAHLYRNVSVYTELLYFLLLFSECGNKLSLVIELVPIVSAAINCLTFQFLHIV
jgi:hypothetical protein